MTLFAIAAFWGALAMLLYHYAGYPLVLTALAAVRRRARLPMAPSREETPPVTVLMSVHNEGAILAAKLENLRALDYPDGCLTILIGDDGSADNTPDILRDVAAADPRFTIVRCEERAGKLAVLNRLVSRATGELLLLTDCDALACPDFLRVIASAFRDPSVGAVAAHRRYAQVGGAAPSGGEATYLSLEAWVCDRESEVRTTVGAWGGLYAVRRELYAPLPSLVVHDDLYTILRIALAGKRVLTCPEAIGIDTRRPDIADEFRRKIRMSSRGLHTLRALPRVISPASGFLAFAFWSHKILRWAVPSLLLLFILSASMLAGSAPIYTAGFAAATAFLVAAATGALLDRTRFADTLFHYPFFFLLMNAGLLVGWFRFLAGREESVWNRKST